MTAKSPSEAWQVLASVVEDENSSLAKEHAKKNFEILAMMGESAREYVARAKGLASAVKYRGVDVTDEEVYQRILTGLPLGVHGACS